MDFFFTLPFFFPEGLGDSLCSPSSDVTFWLLGWAAVDFSALCGRELSVIDSWITTDFCFEGPFFTEESTLAVSSVISVSVSRFLMNSSRTALISILFGLSCVSVISGTCGKPPHWSVCG